MINQAEQVIKIGPQPGPQEDTMASSADIVVSGGGAGGGKTYGTLLEPLRHVTTNPDFAAIIFRRNATHIRAPGGLWQESRRMYSCMNAKPKESTLEWQFMKYDDEAGGKLSLAGLIKMAHLEHPDKTIYDYQGAQVPLILWDELTHFTRFEFFYMLSRCRSMSGVRGYVRATCNPDPESWVAEFLAWWIDQEEKLADGTRNPRYGLPIPERCGKLRWFIRLGNDDNLVWGDSKEELIEKYQHLSSDPLDPKSVTFIPSRIYDNKALMAKDPGYLSMLRALPLVERERLLGGNWKIKPAAGLMFRRSWCRAVQAADVVWGDYDWVRYWDLAATKKTEDNDPDWTVGVRLGKNRNTGRYLIAHVVRMREDPGQRDREIKNTALADTSFTRIGIPQDPGQAGKSQVRSFANELDGYSLHSRPENGDKITRFGPFSSACEHGRVDYVEGPWNEAFLSSLEGFSPDAAHDDDADACSGAYNMFLDNETGILDYYAKLAAEIEEARQLKQSNGGATQQPSGMIALMQVGHNS